MILSNGLLVATPVKNTCQSILYLQDMVAEICVEYFQRYRRQTHVTPKSYLSFLSGYKAVYKEKKDAIGQLAERMNTGDSEWCNNRQKKLVVVC